MFKSNLNSSRTLMFYFSRRFLLCEMISIAVFTFIIDIFDFSDMLRKWAHQPLHALGATVSHTPDHVMLLLPFSLFIATMGCFYSLNKRKELSALFMEGLSPLSLAICPVLLSLVLGLLATCLIPSLTAKSRNTLISTQNSVSKTWPNLWTMQTLEDGNKVLIHLENATIKRDTSCQSRTSQVLTAQSATLYKMDDDEHFKERINSLNPSLCSYHWEFKDPILFDSLGHPTALPGLSFQSPLSPNEIASTASAFNMFPVWKLHGFIARLHAAGFDVLKYKIYLQTLLALPFFCAIMTLAACTASSSFNPLTHLLSPLFLVELGIGFALFAFIHVAEQIGKMGIISPFIAIWVPLIMTFGVLAHFFLNRGLRQ